MRGASKLENLKLFDEFLEKRFAAPAKGLTSSSYSPSFKDFRKRQASVVTCFQSHNFQHFH